MTTIQWFVVVAAVCVVAIPVDNLTHSESEQDQVSSPPSASIPLIKCCPHHQLYRPGLDLCRHGLAADSLRLQVASLPVHKRHDNSSASLTHYKIRDELENDIMLLPCPAGFVAKSAMFFKLYQDLSMETDQGLIREAGNYCVNAVYPSPGDQQLRYAVRYCEQDNCQGQSCLRKCCPLGMVVDEMGKACERTSIADSFEEDVHQVLNVDLSKTRIVDSYGIGTVCHQMNLKYQPLKMSEFRILEDGQLHASAYPCDQKSTLHYCVDYFVKGNVTVIKGLRCFPQHGRVAPNGTEVASLMVDSYYPYLMFTSSGFLVLTFGVYAVLPEMRNMQGLIVMCHVASMAVVFVGLAMIQLHLVAPGLSSSNSIPHVGCTIFGSVVHFAFLATFSWLHVMCFDIWWTFRSIRPRAFTHSGANRHHKMNSTFLAYSLFGWGLPLVVVGIGQFLEQVVAKDRHFVTPDFGQRNTCWFTCSESLLAYLYGPIAILIFCNVIFFLLTSVHLFRTRKDSALASRNSHVGTRNSAKTAPSVTNQRIRIIFTLFIVMGVFWTMELVAFAVGNSYTVWYIFDTYNILTGVFVFFLFVCKPKVWNLLKKRFPILRNLNRQEMNRTNTSSQMISISNRTILTNQFRSSKRKNRKERIAHPEHTTVEHNPTTCENVISTITEANEIAP